MDRVQEARHKVDRAREWLAGTIYGGVLLESAANFAWITAGGDSAVSISEERGVAAVLVTPQRAVVITPNNERRRLVEEQLPESGFEVADYPWYLPERREELIAGFVSAAPAAADLPSETRPVAGPKLTELRRVLTEPEIERYRDLGRDAAFVVESACRAIEPKDSELDAAARVEAMCRERGLHAVVSLAGADDRATRHRHPVPTTRRASRTMMLALTARRGGLHVSLTRTVCFGEPDPEQQAGHAACARVDAWLIGRSRPGARLSELIQTAAEQYSAAGYPDEWRHHHQGGLTGYAGREVFATPDSGYLLKANQALAWNPTVPGAKSEDTIVVTYGGVEVLTESGHWPQVEVEVEVHGTVPVGRPALLVR